VKKVVAIVAVVIGVLLVLGVVGDRVAASAAERTITDRVAADLRAPPTCTRRSTASRAHAGGKELPRRSPAYCGSRFQHVSPRTADRVDAVRACSRARTKPAG
jgi:hypothetical protein